MPGKAKNRPAREATEAAMYLGEHLRGLDQSRVILPAEWRQPGWPREFAVIGWPLTEADHFLVLPPERLETVWRNLSVKSLTDRSAEMVKRCLGARTTRRALDRAGRLPLPEEIATKLGLTTEARLVGCYNTFEVWQPERFSGAVKETDPELLKEALKELMI